MKRRATIGIIGTILAAFLGTNTMAFATEDPKTASPPESTQAVLSLDLDAINLNRPIHFTAPDGSDVVVPPAIYKVEAMGEQLRLLSHEKQEAILIQAKKGKHETALRSPTALSIPGPTEEEEDLHYVALLLPGGETFETTGTYSGIRPRGLFDKPRQGLQQARQNLRERVDARREQIQEAREKVQDFARVQACKLVVGAIRIGRTVQQGLAQILSNAKQRLDGLQGRIQRDPAFRQRLVGQMTQKLTQHQHAVPELKRIAARMNDPKNRAAMDSLFTADNFCQDLGSAMDAKLIQLGLAPNFALVHGRGAGDPHFYLGFQFTLGAGAMLGGQTGLLFVTDFRGNRGLHWFIGPMGVTNVTASGVFEVAFFPNVTLESFGGWGTGIGVSAGPPTQIVQGAVDFFFAEGIVKNLFQDPPPPWQGFGIGGGIGAGVSPVDVNVSTAHSWKF